MTPNGLWSRKRRYTFARLIFFGPRVTMTRPSLGSTTQCSTALRLLSHEEVAHTHLIEELSRDLGDIWSRRASYQPRCIVGCKKASTSAKQVITHLCPRLRKGMSRICNRKRKSSAVGSRLCSRTELSPDHSSSRVACLPCLPAARLALQRARFLLKIAQ